MSVKEEFIIKRDGKNFVLYAGLLDLAHGQGLRNISTTIIQIPTKDNEFVAICQAEVETDKGHFSGVGDASPQNVSRPMLNCLLRLAETRAKARALRDATNVGVAAFEELDDGQGEDLDNQGQSGQYTRALPDPLEMPLPPATEKQVAAIYDIAKNSLRLSKAALFERCQREFGCTPDELSKSAASRFISLLKEEAA